VADTLIFIPAWNEAESLPDVLVIDDGSSFKGRRAVGLVVTIALTLFGGELLRRRHQRRRG